MGSEPRQPGGPAGIERVLRERFRVSPTPTIGRDEAARRILEKARQQNVRCERLDVSDQPVSRGSLFNAAGARVLFPEGDVFDRSYVALIDPEPTARWAHPAYWAFVPASGEGDVVLKDTDLPEHRTGPVRLLPVSLEP
jgi:hypothetical protein